MAAEIVFGPGTVFLGDVGTARPEISAAPPNPWRQLGKVGSRSVAPGGVTFTYTPESVEVMTDGATGIRDARITKEGVMISGALIDHELETVALLFNGKTINSTAAAPATGGTKEISIYTGPVAVTEYAVLVEVNDSAYGPSYKSQIWIPRMYVSSPAEMVYTKDNPVQVAFEFKGMEWEAASSSDSRFGSMVHQFAPAA